MLYANTTLQTTHSFDQGVTWFEVIADKVVFSEQSIGAVEVLEKLKQI